MRDRNIWLDGIMGLVTGDALGSPVQFMSRSEIRKQGLVEGMEAGGTYGHPAGTWSDDSSMTLATVDSFLMKGGIDPDDIMMRFMKWYYNGEYTPFGRSFDRGATCSQAIKAYAESHDWETCGRTDEYANGNGALMRILPACLYCINLKDDRAEKIVGDLTGITHNHMRARMASILYFYLARSIVKRNGSLQDRLLQGSDDFFDYKGASHEETVECRHLYRTAEIIEYGERDFKEEDIKSTGYVIDSLEAAVWSLMTTDSFESCLLRAVNLGDDADTVGAIAGGLAGLYYGYEAIPPKWLHVIPRRQWIEDLCEAANARYTAR